MRSVFKIASPLLAALMFLASGLHAQAPAEAPAKPACDCSEVELMNGRLAVLEKRLQDWPDLAHYREANAKVIAPAKDEQRVVFMGDSITDMWVQPRFGAFFPGQPYIGRGIGGQTTPQMLLRFREDVIALQPKVVVILAGTNDIAGNTGPIRVEDIEDNYTSLAELAAAHHI